MPHSLTCNKICKCGFFCEKETKHSEIKTYTNVYSYSQINASGFLLISIVMLTLLCDESEIEPNHILKSILIFILLEPLSHVHDDLENAVNKLKGKTWVGYKMLHTL